MSATADAPYVGLPPFSRAYERYFFGRTLDARIIASNALTRAITVLFAASGVGKSSVLLAGLPHALEDTYSVVDVAAQKRWEQPSLIGDADVSIVVQRNWHEPEHAVPWLERMIASAPANKTLILVFDQFEDYLLYRRKQTGEAFEERLADFLSDGERSLHLVLSLREDTLHRLDQLRLSLPSVLDNTLELEHLDEIAVREAIEGPIAVFNRENPGSEVRIGPAFVEDLLDEMRTASKTIRVGRADDEFRVGLPFLQLTLKKLWERMRSSERGSLDTDLLREMDGVDGIVRAHLEERLGGLNEPDQLLAIRLFHYMVTPSGGKIAYTAEDLASLATESGGSAVDVANTEALLEGLAAGESRVLRRIGDQFELFHDVLARPLLDWRAKQFAIVPFAYLTEVWLGMEIPLYGAGGLFIRWGKEYRETTPLALPMISRTHFVVMWDGTILDMRSRFGTTVNAQPHHFGDGSLDLKSGDIIGVGNTAALVFRMVLDPTPQLLDSIGTNGLLERTGDAWGLLIDGAVRNILALSGPRLHLVRDEDGRIEARPEPTAGAFATLACASRFDVVIRSLVDAPRLLVIDREDAFHDDIKVLPTGAESHVLLDEVPPPPNPRSMSDQEGARRGLYRIDGAPFEIILRYIWPEASEDADAGAEDSV